MSNPTFEVPNVSLEDTLADSPGISPAIAVIAEALCEAHYRGSVECIFSTVRENWFRWVPAAENVLKAVTAASSELAIVPGWALQLLATDALVYYREVGDEIGKAGHAASEQLQNEFLAVELANKAVAGVTIKAPEVIM